MKRRDLLRAATGVTLGAGLAGCLGTGGGGGGDGDGDGDGNGNGGTPTDGEPTTQPPTTTDGGVDWPDDPTPFDSLAVGDRSTVDFAANNRAIDVRLWNAVDEERTLAVRVTTPDDAPGLRRDVTFPAGGVLDLSLSEPDSYTVSVGSLGSVSVPFGSFDCNQTTYQVRLGTASLDHTWFATEIACPDPELGDVTVESGEGDCGSEDRATVTFADETVRVEGAMRTPDPCHSVDVRTADYDRDADTLELVLEAVPGEDGCIECVGQVPYEATATFEHDYPRVVVVRHASIGQVREVARVDRSRGG